MAHPITMPKLGQMTEESTIVRWLKREGEPVGKGEILFEIETDKAVMEVESFFDGTLLKIVVPENQAVPVMSTVAFVGTPGEPIQEVQPVQPAPSIPVSQPETRAASPSPAAAARPSTRALPPSAAVPPPAEPARPRISPRARRLAKEKGIHVTGIQGTGPGGRVIERDVQGYLIARGYDRLTVTPAAKQLAAEESLDLLRIHSRTGDNRISVEDVRTAMAERPRPLGRMRQVIAERLTESFTTTPHFFVTVSVDVTEISDLRERLKQQGQSYTMSDFIVHASALALSEFPDVNSSTDGKNVEWHSRVDIGLAVSLDNGLVVPVIRDVQDLGIEDIHARSAELIGKARTGKLTPDEMTGSTFTISNMGMLDVENFTAIINPGESAILAVSSARPAPVARDGEVVVRTMMKMTLSSDHRLIDGALAARFINAIKTRMEDMSLWDLTM